MDLKVSSAIRMSTFSFVHFFVLNVIFAATKASISEKFQEWIVTDLNLIEDPRGMPLDFGYNETIQENNKELLSAPGCPKSVDGYPWIYKFHRISKSRVELRCHLAGTQGPCPLGKMLFLQTGTMYGVCGCECLLKKQNVEMKFSEDGNPDDLERYQLCYTSDIPQGQVFDKMDKTVCHNLGEKGPCPDGKVLAVAVATNWIGPSPLACLPICDLSDEKWISQQINGECTVVTNGIPPASGASINLLANDCPDDERYSGTLKKCVKRNLTRHLFLG